MMPTRTVLDTNVLISLWLFDDSRFSPIRLACQDGRLQALTSPSCLEEFRRVLRYPLFKADEDKIQVALAGYVAVVEEVTHVPSHAAPLPRCKDPDDQKFLELARDGDATLLVTQDKALLKLARRKMCRFDIITPDKLLDRLVAGAGLT